MHGSREGGVELFQASRRWLHFRVRHLDVSGDLGEWKTSGIRTQTRSDGIYLLAGPW